MAKLKSFVDFDLNFIPNPNSGDIALIKDDRAVGIALKNLILTEFYERPFQPWIGSSVAGALFEMDNKATSFLIDHTIREVINNFEERCNITSIDANTSDNSIEVSITYSVQGIVDDQTIRIALERTR